jgi:hypothetical protein
MADLAAAQRAADPAAVQRAADPADPAAARRAADLADAQLVAALAAARRVADLAAAQRVADLAAAQRVADLAAAQRAADLMERNERETKKQCLNAANTILVGAALIATITYATWVLVPLTNVTYQNAVKTFWVCNSLSFYSAIVTVWFCVWAVWPYDEEMAFRCCNSLKNRIRWAAGSFGFSYCCVFAAYSSGAYISMANETLPFLITEGYILGMIVVGVVICVIILVISLILAYLG